MSYCRWSTDNYSCDIYAYESCFDGFEINVASYKYKGCVPKVDYKLIASGDTSKFSEQYAAQLKYLETCGTRSIGLKYDGETFSCDTLEEMKDILIMLVNEGYSLPDYVLNDIDEEIKELRNV